jgi:hypothetical protein
MENELRLSVKPEWTELERVNNQVASFLASRELSPGEVDTYTMVICELVENGIKYGASQGTQCESVEVRASVSDNAITVHVSNRVGKASRPYLRQLDRTLQWIRGFQDPFEAYLERVKEISREPLSHQRSGLGIVRIAYEGHAAIDFVLAEDDRLDVSAVAKIS